MQGIEKHLDEVLNSKIYINDKNALQFASPRQFIEPFMEKFAKAGVAVDYTCNVAERVANKEAEGDVLNEAYGRVVVTAKLPNDFTKHSHNSVIGLSYALDTAKPSVRVFSGQEAWACTNLAIFGAQYVAETPILSGWTGLYDKTLEYVEGATKQLAKFNEIYLKMNDTYYQHENIDRIVGYLLREGNRNKQIGTTAIVSAMRDLDDPKSKYAIVDSRTSQWNVLSAITQYVTDKVDAFERPVKTQLVTNLFVKEI